MGRNLALKVSLYVHFRRRSDVVNKVASEEFIES